MIRHLFKLMWNQKRKNIGLLTEVFFSFLVIFAVFSFLIYNYNRYQEPLGFSYDRLWVVQFQPNRENDVSREAFFERVHEQIEQIDQKVKTYSEFESYTFSGGNLPYVGNQSLTILSSEGKDVNPHIYYTDEHYLEVYGIDVVNGRWFHKSEMQNQTVPIIINKALQTQLFGDKDMIGEEIPGHRDIPFKIVGQVNNFKQGGEFSQIEPCFFRPIGTFPPFALTVKVKPNVDAAVEERLFDDILAITKDWSIEIKYMDELREETLLETWLPALIFLIISGFLIFNVALGLFGVVWQNINKRKQEIGVRRAMGATKSNIQAQIIGETAVLATLSMILGSFFAIQFPLLNVFNLETEVYLVAMVIAISFIYLIVLICSFYPSLLAAKMHPAVALHEE